MRELQLLHVTRKLQRQVAYPEDAIRLNEERLLEAQIQHERRMQEFRVALKQRSLWGVTDAAAK